MSDMRLGRAVLGLSKRKLRGVGDKEVWIEIEITRSYLEVVLALDCLNFVLKLSRIRGIRQHLQTADFDLKTESA
jgi:hypothetical protein